MKAIGWLAKQIEQTEKEHKKLPLWLRELLDKEMEEFSAR